MNDPDVCPKECKQMIREALAQRKEEKEKNPRICLGKEESFC